MCGGSPSSSQISHLNLRWQSSIHLIFSTLAKITVCHWQSPNAEYKLSCSYLLFLSLLSALKPPLYPCQEHAPALTNREGALMPLCEEVCYKVGSFLHGSSIGSWRKRLGELDEQRLLGELWLRCSFMFEHPQNVAAGGSEESWPLVSLCPLLAGSTEGVALFLNGFHVHVTSNVSVSVFLIA